jgi:hypothetical protein
MEQRRHRLRHSQGLADPLNWRFFSAGRIEI